MVRIKTGGFNKKTLLGGSRGLPKRLMIKGRTKSLSMKRARKRAESARKSRQQALATTFIVLVMGQSLLPSISSVNHTKKQQLAKVSRSSVKNFNIQEVWQIACTGNTCRSPALMLAGKINGYNINTCGTNAANPGSSATPASLTALKDKPMEYKLLLEHRSKKCDPGIEKFFSGPSNINQRRVFGVVAQENKNDILRMWKELGSPEPKPDVRVLGDVVPGCGEMKVDPYYVSKSAVCPDGNCTKSQLATESSAYKQLHVDADKCIRELIDLQSRGGPSLGSFKSVRRSSKLSMIEE
jgi:hypothetical protein